MWVKCLMFMLLWWVLAVAKVVLMVFIEVLANIENGVVF